MLVSSLPAGSALQQPTPSTRVRKPILWAAILICFAFFFLFILPNSQASQDLSMVGVFEPDESELFPVLERMLQPKPDLLTTLKNFIAYGRYNKGFPFYGPSALVVLPFYKQDGDTNYTAAFLALRQLISIFPSLLAIFLLVAMHTGYRSWLSLLLLILLLAIPAQVQNSFWWHPDGLALLGAVLVLYLFWKDDLKLGKHYFWAAVACGVLTATKSIGVFFAPMVLMVLIWSIASKRSSPRVAIQRAFLFIGLMAFSFLISNPFLFSDWGRASFWNIMTSQFSMLSDGYELYYPKGFLAAWPAVRDTYGSLIFLLTSFVCALLGLAVQGKRLLHALTLAWFFPLTLYLVFFSHFKFQYWLPVALPLFACTAILIHQDKNTFQIPKLLRLLLIAVILVQLAFFIRQDALSFTSRIERAATSPTIQTYPKISLLLDPIKDQAINIYVDPRLYFPARDPWTIEKRYDMLSLDYLSQGNFAVIYLSQQRISDYINDDAQPIDPDSFTPNLPFYRNAHQGDIGGYKLLYRDEHALLFIWRDFCRLHLPVGACQ